MNESSTLYVGPDVRKDSIGGDLASLDNALRRLSSKGRPLHIVGFVIWRQLQEQGLCCEVVVPSFIARPPRD